MELVEIPFTQFDLPNGRRRAASFSRPSGTAQIAAELIADGHEFHCEVLSTGVVSLTCFNHATCEDIAIELCANGPEVPAAVDRLIRAAKEEAAAPTA